MSVRCSGTMFVFLAAVLYSTAGLCMKLIPWSGMALNGGRSIIALGVLGAYLLITRHKPKLNRWVLLGAAAVCGTNVLFALANKMTTAANAIVLQYTAPIFVILLSFVLLKKKPGRLDLVACAVVFLGVVCFFVESLGGGQLAGDVISLVSGITYAGVFLLNDMPDGDPIASVFWGAVGSVLAGLPFMTDLPPLGTAGVVSMLVLGVFQMGGAFLCLTIGLRTTPPVTASLVSGIEPVLNPVLVALFYGEVMGPLSFLGAVIVVGGVVGYNVLLTKRKGKETQDVPACSGNAVSSAPGKEDGIKVP